ncbi:protein Abitram-like isoform X2 [Salvia hispanica]|uniref:protein Abitram-like isoform X2 n=1 Tax=Salvia hispanica TaxID=49212 RepID=UPI00200902FD|nr:protein Abitram-like isoform X2 [Salvia hispanica]
MKNFYGFCCLIWTNCRKFPLPLLKPISQLFSLQLCVIGLAPHHVALKKNGGIVSVDFNVGKLDLSGIKVAGKRKKNAQHFESNTALYKVLTAEGSYIVRCCVKGPLLEVNDRLIKQPELLNTMIARGRGVCCNYDAKTCRLAQSQGLSAGL